MAAPFVIDPALSLASLPATTSTSLSGDTSSDTSIGYDSDEEALMQYAVHDENGNLVRHPDGQLPCPHRGCPVAGTKEQVLRHMRQTRFHALCVLECSCCNGLVREGVWARDADNHCSHIKCSHLGCEYVPDGKNREQRRQDLRKHETDPHVHRHHILAHANVCPACKFYEIRPRPKHAPSTWRAASKGHQHNPARRNMSLYQFSRFWDGRRCRHFGCKFRVGFQVDDESARRKLLFHELNLQVHKDHKDDVEKQEGCPACVAHSLV